jgi:hypothetical protein
LTRNEPAASIHVSRLGFDQLLLGVRGSNADADVVLVRERIQSGGAARIIRRRRAAS